MEAAVYRAMGSLQDPKYAARLRAERDARNRREVRPAMPWWERIPAGFAAAVTSDVERVN